MLCAFLARKGVREAAPLTEIQVSDAESRGLGISSDPTVRLKLSNSVNLYAVRNYGTHGTQIAKTSARQGVNGPRHALDYEE